MTFKRKVKHMIFSNSNLISSYGFWMSYFCLMQNNFEGHNNNVILMKDYS